MTRDGERRTDLAGTFVTQRAVRSGGDPIWRLRVDTGREVCDVFLARAGVRHDLRTGDEYVFAGARACTRDSILDEECPACGGRLREWTAVDDYPAVRAALEQFDVGDEFYVVDEATTVRPAGDAAGDSGEDDWRPWRTGVPDGYVCSDCGREVDPAAVSRPQFGNGLSMHSGAWRYER